MIKHAIGSFEAITSDKTRAKQSRNGSTQLVSKVGITLISEIECYVLKQAIVNGLERKVRVVGLSGRVEIGVNYSNTETFGVKDVC